jgi:uncharacterized protein (DUF736 family)
VNSQSACFPPALKGALAETKGEKIMTPVGAAWKKANRGGSEDLSASLDDPSFPGVAMPAR